MSWFFFLGNSVPTFALVLSAIFLVIAFFSFITFRFDSVSPCYYRSKVTSFPPERPLTPHNLEYKGIRRSTAHTINTIYRDMHDLEADRSRTSRSNSLFPPEASEDDDNTLIVDARPRLNNFVERKTRFVD